ncbi:MAG: HPP family protein [Spirochaetaceae bacterium]|jgi:CBS-domain-containing membrane protein|nr:HPP family protein [Spirochaetaceae bacterium]
MIEKYKSKTPLKWDGKTLVFVFIGGFTVIGILSLLTNATELVFLMAPYGASCVLAFAAWEVPLAQPRNIIGGHFLASLTGFAVLQLLGNHPWSLAIGVGLALVVMVITKTTHPPAGADPIIIITSGVAWQFLLFPVLTGSILLTIIAVLLNRLVFRRPYPKFWY